MRIFLEKLLLLVLMATLAACGSSGGDSDFDPGAATAGVAVDPYIAGAVFKEVTADGQVLQRESTPTDEFGRFTFPQPVQPGSILEMKVDRRGTHNGFPYQGLLKRKVEVDDAGTLVVSPLTTLLANGVAPEELLSILGEAGLTGMTAADLERDPMAGLENLRAGEVAAEQLRNLQAAMAVNAFLHLLNDYAADAGTLASAANRQMMADLVEATQEVLNPARFQELATAIAADAEMKGEPMLLGDMIRLAAEAMQKVESLRDTGGPLRLPSGSEIARSVDDAMVSAPDAARRYMQERMGGVSPSPVPPGATPSPVPDGETLFAAQCAGCHNIGQTSTKMNLAGDGSLIQAKFPGHMGINLTAEEITAVANYADGLLPAPAPAPAPAPEPAPTPVPDPSPVPAPTADGKTIYDNRCAGCHRLGSYDANGSPDLAGKNGAIAGKLQAGHMGISLSAAEVSALADWVATNSPTPTPVPIPDPAPAPGPDGKTLYDNRCAGCHKLGTYDASGAPDLAGKSGRVGAKTAGGHGGGPFAPDTLAALVAFVEANTPATDPETPPAPPTYSDCTGCHGQPPTGTASPNTAGAHAVHRDLPGIGTDCTTCHRGASHDSQVDVVFTAVYNAKSGAATRNSDGTCSNVSCHGGKTTPAWASGRLDVSQCTSCHSAGTTQYNGYYSGKHSKHVADKRLACTTCHETGKLSINHFTTLATPAMEGPARSTIGGGTTRVSSYNPTTRNCTTSCHGNKSW